MPLEHRPQWGQARMSAPAGSWQDLKEHEVVMRLNQMLDAAGQAGQASISLEKLTSALQAGHVRGCYMFDYSTNGGDGAWHDLERDYEHSHRRIDVYPKAIPLLASIATGNPNDWL
eukprot:gene21491-28470_t